MTRSPTIEAFALYERLCAQLATTNDRERLERLYRISARAHARWLRRWSRKLAEVGRVLAEARAMRGDP